MPLPAAQASHGVDADAKDVLGILLEANQIEERAFWLELHQQVDVTVGGVIAPRDRAEHADVSHSMSMGSLLALTQLDRPDLKEEPWTPATQPANFLGLYRLASTRALSRSSYACLHRNPERVAP